MKILKIKAGELFPLDGKYYLVSSFGYRWFEFAKRKHSGWFRLFGKGVSWKHKSRGLLFSERLGITKYIQLGSYYFTLI